MSEELVAKDAFEVGLAELLCLDYLLHPCLVAPSTLEEPVAEDTVAAMCSLEAVLIEQALPLLAGSSQCLHNLMHRNTGH
mmetsp:Transcript_53081/g.102590  ORF Transcript_53081/g.102590 Transcript_53081/m.102590 type:complete len:80 (-) Transcript_53081:450-689(-)